MLGIAHHAKAPASHWESWERTFTSNALLVNATKRPHIVRSSTMLLITKGSIKKKPIFPDGECPAIIILAVA